MAGRARQGHDGIMWTLITLLWRILTRLMRRLGMGALLVPVSAMGMALAGVHIWTVALVLIALGVVFRKPLLAAALLPLSMVSAGLAGLVVAALTPGGSVSWMVRAVLTKPPEWVALPALPAVRVQAGKVGQPATWAVIKAQPGRWAEWTFFGRQPAKMAMLGQYVQVKPSSPPAAVAIGVTGGAPGWWQGKLLVPVALLLLTVGLWLMPRSLARLRQRAGPLAPYLRHRLRETGWGLALVPVTVISLSVFGVRPWTVAAVIAALVITIRWPKVAADLVPFVLIALALRGFQLAARWGSLSPGLAEPGVPYGFVTVGGRQSALAAGAEASAFLAFGAWLVPRTVGAHLRTLFGRAPDTDLAGRVQRLTETRGHAVDAAAAELRRIERDLHDGAQARLVALGMNLRAVERVLPGSPNAASATRSRHWRWTPRCRSRWTSTCRAARPRRSSRPATSRSPRPWPTRSSTPARAVPRSASGTPPAYCASRCPTTGSAAPTRRWAPGCWAWSAGWAPSMASWQ